MERDFLQIPDFSRDEITSLFDIADRMKSGKYQKRPPSAPLGACAG